MFSKIMTKKSTRSYSDNIDRLKQAIADADAVIIGAGAGLSTSAGFTYSGERFKTYFADFEEKYRFHDMYRGGFYPYETLEEYWGYWSRYIYINRYMSAPKNTYDKLFALVKDKDYYVLTTNVDHCFQKAGFDKKRIFYTQGDYGLFQCSKPCCNETYDNADIVRDMVLAQGFTIDDNCNLLKPDNVELKMSVSSELVPRCPHCNRPMTMNLRADDTFVEDEGWHAAAENYQTFIRRHEGLNVVLLELGVGYNTPSIIKYNFWHMAAANPGVVYVCVNLDEAEAPAEIARRAVCIEADIDGVISDLSGII